MHQEWVWIIVLPILQHCIPSSSALKGPPKLHPHPRLVTAEEGDQIKLQCPISANPEPLFEWRKDGHAVDETWPRYVLRRHFLRIKSAREEDTGEFTCTGVNGFGQVSFTFSLLVYGENLPPMASQTPPKWVDISPSPGALVTRPGETLTMVCKAEGVPLPKVTWSKDGEPLHKSGPKLQHGVDSLLDSGVFSCTASNPLAIITHNFTIVVEENSDDKPEILQTANTTVVEGGNTTLQCLVRSFLLPEIQWLKLLTPSEVASLTPSMRNTTLHRDGRTFQYLSRPGARLQRENATYMSKLVVSNASPKDAGVYFCVGATVKGYNYKEVHLAVVPAVRQTLSNRNNSEETELNILFLVLPIAGVVVVGVAILFIYKVFQDPPEKPPPTGTQNISLESEDPTSHTPLNSYKHAKVANNLPPDVVYQDGSSYTTHLSNMGPINGSIRYTDQYLYPENSYLEPNYSDPYLEPHDASQRPDGKGFETRGSDHSYARLTQSTQSSTSPLPPPPYAYQLPYPSNPPPPHSHSLSHHSIHHSTPSNTPFSYTSPHPHRDTQYVVHYNL